MIRRGQVPAALSTFIWKRRHKVVFEDQDCETALCFARAERRGIAVRLSFGGELMCICIPHVTRVEP